MIHDNILGTIGRTPIVRIQRLAPSHAAMFVKCEFFNPLASVKDRLAIALIEHAERTGALTSGQTVVEATSGNTGIALAMVCAVKGYPFVATMAETLLGGTPQDHSHARRHGHPDAGRRARDGHGAPEILSDFAGKRLDYFVTGWGTGGTLTGAGQMIRLARPDVQIIATEPAGAALLSGKPFTPHKIQGWTPDFVPAVLDRTVLHRVLPVTDVEAIETARALARREGIFCGIKVADEAPKGSVILAMLPDTGERYLSTALFEGIAEGSDPEP